MRGVCSRSAQFDDGRGVVLSGQRFQQAQAHHQATATAAFEPSGRAGLGFTRYAAHWSSATRFVRAVSARRECCGFHSASASACLLFTCGRAPRSVLLRHVTYVACCSAVVCSVCMVRVRPSSRLRQFKRRANIQRLRSRSYRTMALLVLGREVHERSHSDSQRCAAACGVLANFLPARALAPNALVASLSAPVHLAAAPQQSKEHRSPVCGVLLTAVAPPSERRLVAGPGRGTPSSSGPNPRGITSHAGSPACTRAGA